MLAYAVHRSGLPPGCELVIGAGLPPDPTSLGSLPYGGEAHRLLASAACSRADRVRKGAELDTLNLDDCAAPMPSPEPAPLARESTMK